MGSGGNLLQPDRATPPSERWTPLSEFGGSDIEKNDRNRADAGGQYELQTMGKARDGRPRASEDDEDDNDEDDEEMVFLDDPENALLEDRDAPETTTNTTSRYTPAEERHVKRKLDTHLVLFVALLYLISFLDRSNIGNAKLAGLTHDLHLSDDQYAWLLTAFYLTYIAFEWMTLCYAIFPPHAYIAVCVAAWGVLASLQACVTSFPALLALRALLGVSEAAFVGVPIYVSFFYRPEELAFRTAIFISAAPLATSFAGSLAYAITSLAQWGVKEGTFAVSPWRWLFLVEGFPAVIVALIAWEWLPDNPATARWLTSREQKVAAFRVLQPRSAGSTESSSRHHQPSFTFSSIRQDFLSPILTVLGDLRAYLLAAMFFCCNVAFSSLPVFLPTIIHAMNFSSSNNSSSSTSTATSQLLSAPPFLFAFLAVLTTAALSDRYRARSAPLIFWSLSAALGFMVLAIAGALLTSPYPTSPTLYAWIRETLTAPTTRYAALFPITAGFFCAVALTITWTLNLQQAGGAAGKGTGMAVLNFVGQLGPLLGVRLFPDDEAEGGFVRGMVVCGVAMVSVAGLAGTLRWVVVREGRKKGEGGGDLI